MERASYHVQKEKNGVNPLLTRFPLQPPLISSIWKTRQTTPGRPIEWIAPFKLIVGISTMDCDSPQYIPYMDLYG